MIVAAVEDHWSSDASPIGAMLDDLIALIQTNASVLDDLSRGIRGALNSSEGIMLAALGFLMIAGPRVFKIGDLYEHYRKRHPLPAYRRAHVTNAHIETIRDALRIYLLFLAYLIGVGVTKIFWSHPLLDASDILVQLSFLGSVMGKYRTVQQALVRANSDGRSNVGDVEKWLRERVDGIGLSLPEIGSNMAKVTLLGLPLLLVKAVPVTAPMFVLALEYLKALVE